MEEKLQRPRDLFTAHPATGHEHLVVRYPDNALAGGLAMGFAEAADRIADSFTGAALDDSILLPFVYLYRHAIELELKERISEAAGVRYQLGQITDGTRGLDPMSVGMRLKGDLRHSIGALVAELDRHLEALGLKKVSGPTRKTLSHLASTDPTGESLRYDGSLPEDQDGVNFVSLHAALKSASQYLGAVADAIDSIQQARPCDI